MGRKRVYTVLLCQHVSCNTTFNTAWCERDIRYDPPPARGGVGVVARAPALGEKKNASDLFDTVLARV